jgi:hypothetical protein
MLSKAHKRLRFRRNDQLPITRQLSDSYPGKLISSIIKSRSKISEIEFGKIYYSYRSLISYVKSSPDTDQIKKILWLKEAIEETSKIDAEIGRTISLKTQTFDITKAQRVETGIYAALRELIGSTDQAKQNCFLNISNHSFFCETLHKRNFRGDRSLQPFIRVAWAPLKKAFWVDKNRVFINSFIVDAPRIITLCLLKLSPRFISISGTTKFQRKLHKYKDSIQFNRDIEIEFSLHDRMNLN